MSMTLTNTTNQDYWFGPLHLAGGVGQTLLVDDVSATSLYLTDDTVADAINTLVTSGKVTQTGAAPGFPRATGVPEVLHGDGSPEGLVYAGQGSLYLRRDNSGGTQLYQKGTGIHLNTGWVGLAGAAVTTPTGAILAYGGVTAPTGFLLCDGSEVSRTTYADLFAALGSGAYYGAGNGTTTFNVPDMRGRTPVGLGTHADVNTVGKNEGNITAANRRPTHRTSLTDPGHGHNLGEYAGNGDSTLNYIALFGLDANSAANKTTTQSVRPNTTGMTVGSGNANDSLDTSAYLVNNYIIKT